MMSMHKIMSGKDVELFEKIAGLSEKSLKQTMENYLKKKYEVVISTDDYIIAEGDIPIALVAHMDTVFNYPPEEVFYDRSKNVMWSPDGLGADDRAGVFAIIQLIRKGYRPHIILTTGEESGGVGARTLVKDFSENPFNDLRFVIQLDRRGANDCVFYSCDNPRFTEYISAFGFVEHYGTFTDISVICPAWKIAGTNLSVGYEDEHSVSEILRVNWFLSTVEKVEKILKTEKENIPSFEYIKGSSLYGFSKYYSTGWNDDYAYGDGIVSTSIQCACCHKDCFEYEMMPVKRKNGIGTDMYCIDCAVAIASWCDVRHEAFISDDPEQHYCPDCMEEYFSGGKS
jgi:hypothetical protein